MVREFSAGGVVLRRMSGAWYIAAIEPEHEAVASDAEAKAAPSPPRRKRAARKLVLALPKGIVDDGEQPDETAVREVREETGVIASLLTKLADIKYVYVRTWGDRQRVFKIVTFFLLRYQSGRIDDVTPAMRIEVRQALWIPLDEAASKLAYSGERQVVRRALEYLEAHPDL
jgi:8-oxo-dGTP pyrophosphatase MutT (NUDIX family)